MDRIFSCRPFNALDAGFQIFFLLIMNDGMAVFDTGIALNRPNPLYPGL